MTRQRGQSVVEFALVIPMFALLLFALIYGGIMFLQWFNMSNDSRAEARRYAVMTKEQLQQELGDPLPTESNPKPVPGSRRLSFYNVTQKIWIENDSSTSKPKDVVVLVELERVNNDLPSILNRFDWPPEKLKPLEFRMKLEANF